jgi:ribulose-5-phosphate 4-epimerase/fuculose-1-phosphate aldolase
MDTPVASSLSADSRSAWNIGAAERAVRVELAAAFRIAHHLGWNVDTLNHITARIPGTESFLMNPLGMGWDEITASSLVTLDFDGNMLSHSGVKVGPAGFNFHSGILKRRPDVQCVIHTHETAGTVIGAIECEQVALTQNACFLHREVGYHDFEGLAREEDEVPRIMRDLGAGHALIMRNHGLLSVGATIAEAFGWMRMLIDACATQERAMATGANLRPVSEELQAHTKVQMLRASASRDDYSWDYWMRLAGRLDPSFSS